MYNDYCVLLNSQDETCLNITGIDQCSQCVEGYHFEKRNSCRTLLYRCLAGCLIITCVEFITGIIVNRALGWGVWDYSDMPGNLLGQICITYSALWFLLVIPIIYICRGLRGIFLKNLKQEYP